MLSGRGRKKEEEARRERNEALSVCEPLRGCDGGPFPIGTRRAVEPHVLIFSTASPPLRPDRLYCHRVRCARLDLSLLVSISSPSK